MHRDTPTTEQRHAAEVGLCQVATTIWVVPEEVASVQGNPSRREVMLLLRGGTYITIRNGYVEDVLPLLTGKKFWGPEDQR